MFVIIQNFSSSRTITGLTINPPVISIHSNHLKIQCNSQFPHIISLRFYVYTSPTAYSITRTQLSSVPSLFAVMEFGFSTHVQSSAGFFFFILCICKIFFLPAVICSSLVILIRPAAIRFPNKSLQIYLYYKLQWFYFASEIDIFLE